MSELRAQPEASTSGFRPEKTETSARRRRRASSVSSEFSSSSDVSTAATNRNNNEEEEEEEQVGISVLDIIRVIVTLIIASCTLSYYMTSSESVLWGYRPWFTRWPVVVRYMVWTDS